MRIILDENLPKPLKRIFPGHTVTTVQEESLAGTVNGALLAQLEGKFDVFMTADKTCVISKTFPAAPWRLSNCPRIVSRFSVHCSRASPLSLRPSRPQLMFRSLSET